jgi:hypothetical protein
LAIKVAEDSGYFQYVRWFLYIPCAVLIVFLATNNQYILEGFPTLVHITFFVFYFAANDLKNIPGRILDINIQCAKIANISTIVINLYIMVISLLIEWRIVLLMGICVLFNAIVLFSKYITSMILRSPYSLGYFVVFIGVCIYLVNIAFFYSV